MPTTTTSTTTSTTSSTTASTTTSTDLGFAAGARAAVPMIAGIVPFGLAIGAASSGLGASVLQTWIGSWLLIAGTAQITIMQLLADGAAPLVALTAALIINARFAVYSAGLAVWFPSASRRRRLLLALPLIDQLYLTATAAYAKADLDEEGRWRFYAGAAAHLVAAWVAAQTVGLALGDRVPEALGLHAASLLALVGLLASSVDGRAKRIAASVAAVTTVVGFHLPQHSVVLVAIVAGITAGAHRRRA